MWLTAFHSLLTAQTGLTIAASDYDKVNRFLQHRLAELRLADFSSYLELLSAPSLMADQEWQHIVQALTVPESFFLRDKGQMRILQEHILPELIQRNRFSRQLRIWSAGCSTGEEPYSIALLLQQLLPDIHDWDILILGTDINDKVLTKARAGLYTRWSLRDVDSEILTYFQPAAQGLLSLDAAIRDKVSFRRVNLLQTPFPDLEINEIDLILCRNVFIYFDQQAIASVLEKFIQTLKPHGYLITGHGELYQQALNGLETCLFVESVVYQRSTKKPAALTQHIIETKPPIALSVKAETKPIKPEPTANVPLLSVAASLQQAYQQQDYSNVLAIAQTQPSDIPNFDSSYWSAKAFACMGQYHTAESRLQDALALKPKSADCYYLLAHIKESQNDLESAKALLQKTIVLDENFGPAYLDLAALCEQEEPDRYQQLNAQALARLKQMPPEHYFDDLAAHVRELIPLLPA